MPPSHPPPSHSLSPFPCPTLNPPPKIYTAVSRIWGRKDRCDILIRAPRSGLQRVGPSWRLLRTVPWAGSFPTVAADHMPKTHTKMLSLSTLTFGPQSLACHGRPGQLWFQPEMERCSRRVGGVACGEGGYRGSELWGRAGRRPLGRAPGKETLLTTEQRHQHEDSMKNTPLTCTCTESSSREVCTYRHTRTLTYVRTYTHTHVHTRTHTRKGMARTRHNRRRTSAHAHLAGQTGRIPSPLAAPAHVWERVQHGPRTPARGAALRVPLGHRAAGAGPWRRIAVLPSTRLHLALLAVTAPGCTPGAAGWAGLPTTTSSSCGTEFSHHSLRVSMPLGGKYKRCLSQTQHGSERVSRALSLFWTRAPGRGLGRNER